MPPSTVNRSARHPVINIKATTRMCPACRRTERQGIPRSATGKLIFSHPRAPHPDLIAFIANVDDVEVCFFLGLESARVSLALVVADCATFLKEDDPLAPLALVTVTMALPFPALDANAQEPELTRPSSRGYSR